MTLPIVVSAAGVQPQTPQAVLARLIAAVVATNPGYTANLPASLIEDISSTDVAAILMSDTAFIDALNSLTPFGINEFLLAQLGEQFGVPLNQANNTSVYVRFTGTPGFQIAKGFVVTDGVYQYQIPDGGIVGEDQGFGQGVSDLLYAVATISGSWAVGVGTVSALVTSVPNTVDLTVTNPAPGLPATESQSAESYRAQVWQAGLASTQGIVTMLKTLVGNVTGVQQRLISVRQRAGLWQVIVGGGDPYEVAYAIERSGMNIALLTGSVLEITAITKAANAQITTALNHGKSVGDSITIDDVVGMTQINGLTGTVQSVPSEKVLTVNINSTGFSNYISGGEITPNDRNIEVSVNNYPDSYDIVFINPPQQSVDVTLTWNTTATNFVSASAVAQLGAPALADYINAIPVGQPINIFQMEEVFTLAIASILDPALVTRMVFSVSINGVGTSPNAGTGIVEGDPESYFLTTSTNITITQG